MPHIPASLPQPFALGSGQNTTTEAGVMWQTIIHVVFILSAVGIAAVERMGHAPAPATH